MAVVAEVQIPGGSAQQYEQVLRETGVQHGAVAPGQLVRIARPADGGWRVISVWESRGAFDTFRERLTAAMEKAGAARASIDVAEVHDLAK